MPVRAFAVGTLILTLAGPASAGSKIIVTPRLVPLSDGSLVCGVVNTSDSKSLAFSVSVLGATGALVAGPLFTGLDPLESTELQAVHDGARHCVVRLITGNPKDLRVSLSVLDAGGVTRAALSAPSK